MVVQKVLKKKKQNATIVSHQFATFCSFSVSRSRRLIAHLTRNMSSEKRGVQKNKMHQAHIYVMRKYSHYYYYYLKCSSFCEQRETPKKKHIETHTHNEHI